MADCRDPDCPYRHLYEGSQLSLNEAVARFAQIHTAHNDLRTALVLQLKRNFPRRFSEAEARGGQRFSALSDELLVAYLEAFLGSIHEIDTRANPDDLERLRTALRHRGLAVPDGDDLAAWSTAIETSPTLTVPTSPSAPPPPPSTPPTPTSPDDPTPFFDPDWDEVDSHPRDDLGDLLEIFAPAPTTAANPTPTVPPPATTVPEPAPARTPPAASPSSAPAASPSTAPDGRLRLSGPIPVPPSPRPSPEPAARPVPRPRRSRRTRAEPPDPLLFDVPAEAPRLDPEGHLDDRLRSMLAASVAIPRPVFVADLAQVAGTRDLVEAWERESWEDRDAPVHFIGAKARHRDLGSLIVPTGHLKSPSPEFAQSLWAACLARGITGARLYEVAVLLRRVGADVTDWRFSGDHQVLWLTLAQRPGLVGLIVVLEVNREALAAPLAGVIGEALAQRLVRASVLVTHDPSYDAVRALIRDLAAEHRWDPPFPVTLVRSWEYGRLDVADEVVLG